MTVTLSSGNHAGEQARRPAGSAAEIQNAVAGPERHHVKNRFGDGQVVALHLLAAAFFGPAVEFELKFFFGSHRGHWALMVPFSASVSNLTRETNAPPLNFNSALR